MDSVVIITENQTTNTQNSIPNHLIINQLSYQFHDFRTHVFVVLFFMLFGLPGNSIVLYICFKKGMKSASEKYMVLLAIVDIYALLVVLPQYPFLKYYFKMAIEGSFKMLQFFNVLLAVNVIGYLVILVGITVNRMFAVFSKVNYNMMAKKILIGTGVALVLSFIVAVLLLVPNNNTYNSFLQVKVFLAWISVTFIVIIICYIAIIIKLTQMSKGLRTAQTTNTNNNASYNPKKLFMLPMKKKSQRGMSISSDSLFSSEGIGNPATTGNQRKASHGLQRPPCDTSAPSETSVPRPQRSRVHSRYMTSVKTFMAVSILYMIAFAPSGIRFMFFSYNFEHMTEYCFFFNHIGNPFIYVAFNKSFRNEVKRFLQTWKCCGGR